MATTGYAAAIDTGDVVMSYGPESQWGVLPSLAFQEIRLDSEGFSSSKSRTRPNEISPDGQASAAITTKEESTGSLNFSVSAETHKELFAASIGGVFTTPITFAAQTGVAATASGFTDSGNGFTAGNNFNVGQMIKVTGFADADINTIYRIDSLADGVIATTPVPAATELAGASVTIKGSMCRNGLLFQSFYFQKYLAAAMYLCYPGAWPNGGSLDVGVGDYLKGTLSFLNKDEVKQTSDQSTGAATVAPGGNVIDSIGGIGTVFRNGAAIGGVVQKLGIKWNREGSRAQFGIGSVAALGIGKGKLMFDGSLSTYFSDFTLYDEFKAETAGPVWFSALDGDGKGYVLTLCSASIMNPKIVAGGSGQDIMADFELEGEPGDATIYGGKTFQMDCFD